MNKKVWIVIVAVLILLGVSGYFVLGKKDANKSAQNNTGETQEVSSKKNLNTSLEELAKLGENLQCSFKYTDQTTGSVSSGTVFVAGSKTAGHFQTNDPTSGEIKSNMINDGTFVYTWLDSEKQGTKFQIPESAQDATPEGTSPDQSNNSVDTNQNYEFNCDKWNVDESHFTPPADVQFMDLTAQQQQLQQAVPTDESGVTAEACAQISDPTAQQACLNAVNGTQ